MKNRSILKHILNSLQFFLLIWIHVYILPQDLSAQIKHIQFKHLTNSDGPSYGRVNTITRDKFGFIRIGTDENSDLIDNFDKNPVDYTFFHYKNSNDPSGIIEEITAKLPLCNENGQITGLVCVGRNITEKKKVEEEREPLITEFQEALAGVKMLSGLVANPNYDFNKINT